MSQSRGLDLWRRLLGADAGQSQLVRFGMLLLTHAKTIPAGSFKPIRNGDRLLERMADAGEAIAAKSDYRDALLALIELGHLRTAAWAMDEAEQLPPASASWLYLKLIGRVDGDDAGKMHRASLAMDAAKRLIQIDPQSLVDFMDTVEDDSRTQQTILIGLLNSRCPDAERRIESQAAWLRPSGFDGPYSYRPTLHIA